MPRATASDLVARYDERLLSDLVSDTGTPGNVLSSGRVQYALAGATAQFEAAVRVGGIYSTEDLDSITGDALTFMKDIICELALLRLIGARIETVGKEAYEALRRRAEDYLSALQRGERLFPLDKQITAGKPTIDGPTASDYERLNLLPERAHRYYPRRAARLPVGRG